MGLQAPVEHIFVQTNTAVYSRPMNIEGFNAAHIQATLLSAAMTAQVNISLEISNDQENWVDSGGGTLFNVIQGGSSSTNQGTSPVVGSTWIRIKLVGNTTGVNATVALNVNLFNK